MKSLVPVLCVLPLLLLGGCRTNSTAYNDRGWFDPMMRSLNHKSYGYQIVEDVTGSAPTKFIERFEVRPGDCAANPGGWDDCTTDRERSELSQKNKDILIGDTEWYGWYLFVPKGHQDIYPANLYMGQFHQWKARPAKARPAWMFQNYKGGYYLKNFVNMNWLAIDLLKAQHPNFVEYTELIGFKNFLGKWHKIEVQAKWSEGKDGFFKVYVNRQLKFKFFGRTASAKKIYFKYGIYRAWISNFKGFNNGKPPPTQIVYFTKVNRGGSREDIQ